MKFFALLLILSVSGFAAVTKRSEKINAHISLEYFTVSIGECDLIASVSNQMNTDYILRVVSVKKGEDIHKGGVSCHISKEQYETGLTEILKEYKGPKLTEFGTGYVRNPLDKEWKLKLALASAKDKQFIKMRTEGEQKVTFNSVFSRLASEQKVFDSFIEIHKKLGINLEYERVEKVFRDQVKDAYNKKDLLAAGLKENDRYISGAALIFFKIK